MIFKVNPVVSYTTRPKRNTETQGIEHYFLNRFTHFIMRWKIKLGLDQVVAYTQIGEYEYFATLSELKKKNIYLIDPDGYKTLLENEYIKENNIKIYPIYVKCDYETRMKRALARSNDDVEVFLARNNNEDDQFSRFEKENKTNFNANQMKTVSNEVFCIDNSADDPDIATAKLISKLKQKCYYYDLFCIIGRTGAGKDTLVSKARDYFYKANYDYIRMD